MRFRAILPALLLAAATVGLGSCQQQAADSAAVAQGSKPQGTISDELPDLELLPNDAPLADPADVPPVPGAAPIAPAGVPEDPPSAPAPAPAPAEPALEGSIAQ